MKYIRFIKQIFTNGTKKHKCTNCKSMNYLKGNILEEYEYVIGFCWNCNHPIWN